MEDGYNIFVKRFDPSDKRLGRHVRHDSRSRNFAFEAEDLATLKSVKHPHFIQTLDQGQLGSCTGNATVGCLGTDIFWATAAVKAVLSQTNEAVDENLAVSIYSEATQLDTYDGTYPPTDTGSDGLSVAKVAQKRGLISGYQHALSLEATLTALTKQTVIVGTAWHGDMFHPNPDGRLRITGSIEGGHEYMLDEINVEKKIVWMKNSWGSGWGVTGGRAYLTWDDLGALLADYGDCTIFTPVNLPAPTPTPPAPTPTPAPVPTPVPGLAEFLAAAKVWDQAFQKFLASQQ